MSDRRAQLKSAGGDISGRHTRAAWSLPVFATVATFAFVAVILAPPSVSSAAGQGTEQMSAIARLGATQSLTAGAAAPGSFGRDAFSITDAAESSSVGGAYRGSSAPAAGVPDPGSAQALAQGIVQSLGMGDDQYNCLVALWARESGWNVYAYNESSGAYGIPQSLPGDKMASAGADWASNPATQISWGLSYIVSRYSTPCGAWDHSENRGWY